MFSDSSKLEECYASTGKDLHGHSDVIVSIADVLPFSGLSHHMCAYINSPTSVTCSALHSLTL